MGEFKELTVSVAIASVAIVLGLILNFAMSRLLIKWRPHNQPLIRGHGISIGHFSSPLRALIPAFCLYIALQFVEFPSPIGWGLRQAVLVWITMAVAWCCVRAVYLAGELIVSHVDIGAKDNLRARRISTGLRIMQRLFAAAIWFIAAGAVLTSFGEVKQFGVSMLASAGLAGIIVGFAAQQTLRTVFAGIQIALAQPIRLEDEVIVEEQWGWIEEINLTYVVVRVWDQRRLVVPITYFIDKPFQNWTRTTAELLGTVLLYADYLVPVQDIRDELERVLSLSPLWNRKVWALQVTDTKERTVELRALMSANDASSMWDLRCFVREKLLDFLQRRFPGSLPRTRVEWENAPQTANDAAKRDHLQEGA
jgi:small-conductance mechanosensitive channel